MKTIYHRLIQNFCKEEYTSILSFPRKRESSRKLPSALSLLDSRFRGNDATAKLQVCRKNNRGTTLIEMMVFCALLLVIVNTGAKISLDTGRISAINALAKDRFLAVQEIDTAFRDAVRGASGVMDSAGKYTTSEKVVVLRINDPKHVRVIGAALAPNQFSVLDLEEINGEWKLADMRNFSLPLREINIKQTLKNNAALLDFSYYVKAERGERMKNPMRHSVLANAQCEGAV